MSESLREMLIKFFGNKANVDQAVKVKRFRGARRDGSDISEKAFSFAIDSEKIGHDCKVSDLLGYRILGSKGRPAVTPRNRTQLKYLKTMDENEVVFGVGPAGTGKTYLAMASAINSLQEKKVGRLVLTRPAVEAGEALGFCQGINRKILHIYDLFMTHCMI